uniref:Uncharacterized protein n=1 Tax=Rhizophora mucronata TaxID=61149 RepID=A0A2P2PXP4_RHIMU
MKVKLTQRAILALFHLLCNAIMENCQCFLFLFFHFMLSCACGNAFSSDVIWQSFAVRFGC